ncbi:MAG: STAS domain-containing protein [Anaerolineales bacterium]|nr:STAS domain-containing protein [Anaerolineales bacterium]
MELKAHASGKTQILELGGRFDAYGAPQVVKWFDENLTAGSGNIVVDLAGVNFIDSTALATLVQGMKRARQANGDLRLCSLQQPVRIIFELTRLDKAFDIFASQAEALAAG